MRLLFVTDLHGRIDYLQELPDLAARHRPDLLIFGGDDLPDADPADPLNSQARFARHTLPGYLRAILDRCPNLRIATILGNHDWLCSQDALLELEQQGLLRVLQPDRPLELAGLAFVGYSFAPPSPFVVKDFERLDFPSQAYVFGPGLIWNPQQHLPQRIDPADYFTHLPTIRDDLSGVARPNADWILVAHAPPLHSDLDLLPQAGHVGSQSIRDFIVERSPLLSLHGHIHESPGLTRRFWQRIGSTITINPGRREDRLAAVRIDIAPETVTLTPLNIERADSDPIVLPRAASRRLP